MSDCTVSFSFGGEPLFKGEDATLRDEALIGQTIDDQFEIISLLGRGGHGVIYEARQPDFDRTVALKFFDHSSLNTEIYERFRQEGRILSSIKHPNIMRCFMLGLYQNKIPYLVCELISGETLREKLVREKKLHWQDAVNIVAKICDALAFAEGIGIVHRDLKPDNVMIGLAGNVESIKILDFGLAKLITGPEQLIETESGKLVGTPAYISPEQCRGEKATFRSDIYSLGIMLFELIDGKPPFEQNSVLLLLQKHIAEAPRKPDVTDSLPDPLLGIISKALAKKPGDRFESASEMGSALRNLLSGETINVSPVKTTECSARPVSKPTIVIISAGLFFLFIAVWMMVADPGPIKPILTATSMCYGDKYSPMIQLASFLKKANKPRAASFALRLASGYPQINSVQRIAALAQSVENSVDVDIPLAIDGLHAAQLLCTSCRTDAERLNVARSANTLASTILASRQSGERWEKDLPVKSCAALIQWWQETNQKSRLGTTEKIMPFVDLLYIFECASNKLTCDQAADMLSELMCAAHDDPVMQKKILDTLLASAAVFPDQRDWRKLFNDVLNDPDQDKLFSLLKHGLLANVPGLNPVHMLQFYSKQNKGRMRELQHALDAYCKNHRDPKLDLIKLVLDARQYLDQGNKQGWLENLSEAYFLSVQDKSENQAERFAELTHCVHLFSKQASDSELTTAVKRYLTGNYRLPSDHADELCFSWNTRMKGSDLERSILLKTPDTGVAKVERPLVLSLRGLLLAYTKDFAAAASLLNSAQHDLNSNSDPWVRMVVAWRYACLESLRFNYLSMKQYATAALQDAILVKDPLKADNIRAAIFQADFLLADKSESNDSITFSEFAASPAHRITSRQLAIAALDIIDSFLSRGLLPQARKVTDQSLYLANDPVVDSEMRVAILLRQIDLCNIASVEEKKKYLRKLLNQARDIAQKGGLTELEQLCQDKISRL